MTRNNKYPCGTTSAYVCGCRCAECRAAKQAYNRAYWRRQGRTEKGNPCATDDKVFKSQSAAARALGVSTSTISYHLNRHGDLSRIGKPRGGTTGGNKVPVRIGPRTWPSRSDFFRYLGITEGVGRNWIRCGYADRLLAALMAADARGAA